MDVRESKLISNSLITFELTLLIPPLSKKDPIKNPTKNPGILYIKKPNKPKNHLYTLQNYKWNLIVLSIFEKKSYVSRTYCKTNERRTNK